MTVTLPSTAAAGAAGMTGWVEVAVAALDRAVDPESISGSAARAELADISRLEARQAARKMALLRRIEASTLPRDAGATSTAALISHDFGGDQATCSRQVRAAKNLTIATLTEKALKAGQISFEKADIIAKTVAALPGRLDDLTTARVEQQLILDAQRLTLPDLRRRVLRVADLYASRDQANRDENETLRLREARAWQETHLWISPATHGLVKLVGHLPEAFAALLTHQLDAISAPRRRHLTDDHSPHPDTDTELTHGQRLGRAFCHWIERIPTDHLPTTGGTPATITINLDYNDLTSHVAAATLPNGTRITAGELRRLACNADILPRVLNGKSDILDQGRTQRLFTKAQRLALADREHGCTYPGCDRPPAWTEAHHLDHWATHGGNTDLSRGTLLCARHHHHVHQHNIPGRLHHGHTQWHINGIWQTNHRWRP